MFYMGLILGVAVSAILALAAILGLIFSGKTLAAASSGTPQQVAVAPSPTANPNDVPAPTAKPVPAVDAKDHVIGPKNAKVTLIEYSDFECPFCKQFYGTIKQIQKNYPNDVRIAFRHYPLSFHQNAEKEAEASECVAKLGGNDAFWKFHDKIFTDTTSNGTGFALEQLGPAAKSVGVDQAKFQKCLDSGEMAQVVAADQSSGNDSGVQGTPTTFVNGTAVSGAQPYSVFDQAIKNAGGKG